MNKKQSKELSLKIWRHLGDYLDILDETKIEREKWVSKTVKVIKAWKVSL